MNHVPPAEPKRTSARKAESNRRNAQQSTGPRTPQGKANSRLNALKHGVLASSGVIATIEGREHRDEFETLVDGLATDFEPIGTFEQLLVEDVAACFWRKRRLLRFETRAAFEARDRRIADQIEDYDAYAMRPAYRFGKGKNLDADDILDEAHLGFDLPDERDCLCVARYEGTIARSLRLALSELRRRQAERRKNADANPAQYADRDVVIDKDAMQLNAGPGHVGLGVKVSILTRGLDLEHEMKEQEAREAADPGLKESRETLIETIQKKIHEHMGHRYQTKPNSPVNTETSSREEHAAATPTSGDPAAPKPQE
jgi:hypothetical protein